MIKFSLDKFSLVDKARAYLLKRRAVKALHKVADRRGSVSIYLTVVFSENGVDSENKVPFETIDVVIDSSYAGIGKTIQLADKLIKKEM